MSARRFLPSLVASAVAVVLVVVSVVGYALTTRSTNQQEEALLKSQTAQAADYASEAFGTLSTLLSSTAAVVKATKASPAAFKRAAAVPAPLAEVLVKKTPTGYTVAAATGSGFHTGEVLSGDQLATVTAAGSKLVAGPVNFNGKTSTWRFAIGPPTTPVGYALYEQIVLDPFTITALLTGHAFDDLNAVIYGGRGVSIHDLVVSNSKSTHVGSPSARGTVTVGATKWTLVATARRPFIGGFAKLSPTIILLLGLLMALISGIALEILHRRHVYANELVQERTAELNRSLDDLRAAQDALVRGERLTAVGELATVVSHELRNPLAAVLNALFLIRNEVPEPASELLTRNLSMAEREAQKAARLADDLTAFVRPRETVRSSVEAAELVEEVLSASPPPAGVELVANAEPVHFYADRGQMAEILTNLVANAYQAVSSGGIVRVTSGPDGEGALLVVEDNGPGIAPAAADRVFEPFFTTKAKGTGLGLAIVRGLVISHGGEITWENLAGGGVRFTVRLPRGHEDGTL